MDLANEFNQKELGDVKYNMIFLNFRYFSSNFFDIFSGGQELTRWTVGGASKRGWTTWLVAAVDPERINLACPIVLDALNLQVSPVFLS